MITYKDRTWCSMSNQCPDNITCPRKIHRANILEAAMLKLPVSYTYPTAFDCEYYLESLVEKQNDG